MVKELLQGDITSLAQIAEEANLSTEEVEIVKAKQEEIRKQRAKESALQPDLSSKPPDPGSGGGPSGSSDSSPGGGTGGSGGSSFEGGGSHISSSSVVNTQSNSTGEHTPSPPPSSPLTDSEVSAKEKVEAKERAELELEKEKEKQGPQRPLSLSEILRGLPEERGKGALLLDLDTIMEELGLAKDSKERARVDREAGKIMQKRFLKEGVKISTSDIRIATKNANAKLKVEAKLEQSRPGVPLTHETFRPS